MHRVKAKAEPIRLNRLPDAQKRGLQQRNRWEQFNYVECKSTKFLIQENLYSPKRIYGPEVKKKIKDIFEDRLGNPTTNTSDISNPGILAHALLLQH